MSNYTLRSTDLLAGRAFNIELGPTALRDKAENVKFMPLNMGDIADYSSIIREEKKKDIKSVLVNNNSPSSQVLEALTRLSISTVDEFMQLVSDIFGRTWAVDRAYQKANPGKQKISDKLTIDEVTYISRLIFIVSGVLDPLAEAGEQIKTETPAIASS